MSELIPSIKVSVTIVRHNILTIHLSPSIILEMCQSERCSHCGSYIVDRRDVIECAICDFVAAAMVLPDAMIAKGIRLGKSADLVEVILDHF